MATHPSMESLFELQKRLAAERTHIVQQLTTFSSDEPLPLDALRQLAALHGAARALEEEIETHTPKIGHGDET